MHGRPRRKVRAPEPRLPCGSAPADRRPALAALGNRAWLMDLQATASKRLLLCLCRPVAGVEQVVAGVPEGDADRVGIAVGHGELQLEVPGAGIHDVWSERVPPLEVGLARERRSRAVGAYSEVGQRIRLVLVEAN